MTNEANRNATPREIKITTVGEHDECELCGKVAELRPYGPNGESICADCGMKDEATVKKKFAELLVKTDFLVVGGC